jgi:hypothetical protein
MVSVSKVKSIASDCKKTHRWASVRSDVIPGTYVTFRIVGIGRKYARLMSNSGTIWNHPIGEINRVW